MFGGLPRKEARRHDDGDPDHDPTGDVPDHSSLRNNDAATDDSAKDDGSAEYANGDNLATYRDAAHDQKTRHDERDADKRAVEEERGRHNGNDERPGAHVAKLSTRVGHQAPV
jgi:hypothetical protein